MQKKAHRFLLERERFDFDFDRDFVCPACARCLFTVRAAISFARFVLLPRFLADSLMCSYCRLRFALFTPRGGMDSSLSGRLATHRASDAEVVHAAYR
jgi:hypothetical protein